MLINDASRKTNLTKKAIEYYIEQGLISPIVLDNGYRDFSENDLDCLNKISILRKLELSTGEISAVLADESGQILKKITVEKELAVQRWQVKKAILDKLSCGISYATINAELRGIEQSASITDRLLDTFPGYFGRFICLHFARFLNEPIITEEQQYAYGEIIAFLDTVTSLQTPDNLQEFWDKATHSFDVKNINDIFDGTRQMIENTDSFFTENAKEIEQYIAYKQSDEYRKPPFGLIEAALNTFKSTSGYYEIFIPAMKKLSKSYFEYIKQMEIANEKFLEQYPKMKQLNN